MGTIEQARNLWHKLFARVFVWCGRDLWSAAGGTSRTDLEKKIAVGDIIFPPLAITSV